MREILEHLLQSVDVPNSERAQLHWNEYRTGAASPDPAVKAAADVAFATLLAWYGASLYRHIWGFIRTDAAEDVFQDVLRKLHEKRQSPRLADFHVNVLPWLRTVAIRECVDAHRRAVRRRARETRAARPENEPRSESRDELQEVLAVALARLTPAEQQAIALHYFEGHDKQQTAAILGVNRDTLASRLHAALDRLQRFIPTPASILVGGTLTAPAALTARPPTLSAARLSELVTAAWDKSTEAGWLTGRAAAAALIGLTLCGAAAAGWALTSESPQKPQQSKEVGTLPPVILPRETLQEKNLRILKAEVIPRVRAELQSLLPEDNRITALEPRAYGSEVVLEFRPARRIPGYFEERLVLRFCTLTRKSSSRSYIAEDGRWYDVNPDASFPLLIPSPPSGMTLVQITPYRRVSDEIGRILGILPFDERAEEEQVKYLFGENGWKGSDFTIPASAYLISGNSRTLFVWVIDLGQAFSRSVDGGGWRLVGFLPAWPLCVDETHFYSRASDGHIITRRIDDPQGSWLRVGDMTGCFEPEPWWTAASNGKLFCRATGPTVISKSTHNPDEPWAKLPEIPPSSWMGLASGGGRLFSAGEASVYELPLNQAGAKWQTSGRELPKPRSLAVWGDRVLHIPAESGRIQSRVMSDPDAAWIEMGRVHVPHEWSRSRSQMK